ncbi:15-hydroxyprostaglandin dehydrogenase [Exophiala viscosa]|uniref:15-hydroxyprostaglandin dehydrogenase n=1 Tax=Exophiala viscosa TaxID=2486360 RepID=A0AAN6DK88_9EURO|nr:15-hydroxyprostaglandin dehydrogenase [Exophiala viscosa]KAI1628443.1 15-hydroxyprostaglandin dehydrogenase [Exophiala viscosa]
MSLAEKRVAIVTGAASGIGEALATELVRRGWRVALVDMNADAGEKLATVLGPDAQFFQCNVASYQDQANMFSRVWETWGQIDALCANAGILDRGSLYIFEHRHSDTIPPEPDTLCTDVDYKGVVYGVQLAIHFMRKNKVPGGQIVATSSVVALYPLPSYPEYCGAKAGVLGLVRCMAPVLKAKENITINAVMPGIVPTSIMPQEMLDAVSEECLTPVTTIVAAYVRLLDDRELTGQAIECSAYKLLFSAQPDYLNGWISKRAATVWEPIFKRKHSEFSELPDAIA